MAALPAPAAPQAAGDPSLSPELPPGLVWRGARLAQEAGASLPSGFAALDAALPGGGWPAGALVELFAPRPGVGELSLLLPLMSRTAASQWQAWIAPPFLPYAPALAAAGLTLQRLLWIAPADEREALWATRQAAASGGCHMVLAWLARADMAALRRLQLAAEESRTPVFLFRPAACARQPSPAVLKLQLEVAGEALAVHILKRRGPALAAPLILPLARPGQRRPTPPPAPHPPPAATPDKQSQPHAVVRPDPARSGLAGHPAGVV
jgi:cell division inhibitor SulA/protein ImuA